MGSSDQQPLEGPDFEKGISKNSFGTNKKILGYVGDQPILLIQNEDQFYAVSARCTHYGANLNDGLLCGDTIHCPWHHACFNVKTGEATKAPAINPLAKWQVSEEGDTLFVKAPQNSSSEAPQVTSEDHFVIIGSGAAGHAAAEMLRRQKFQGKITVLSMDKDLPYDRPNLSKDYLAGNAPEEWMPLRSEEYFKEQQIKIQLQTKITQLDTENKTLISEDGQKFSYTKCLIASGGFPVRPEITGIDQPHVHFLKTFADCRKLIKDLGPEKNIVIVGAGFIGLEAATAMRARKMSVTVIAPSSYPLEHAVGADIGKFLQTHHEKNGVRFILGRGKSVKKIAPGKVFLRDDTTFSADVVLIATGIKLSADFLKDSGIHFENGIPVNEFLETNVPDVYAAGDIARFHSDLADEEVRIEHWVVAQRQGQVAAQNMLGQKVAYTDIPFFWSQQFDIVMNYTGVAKKSARTELYGNLEKKDCSVAYWDGDKVTAVLTIGRDLQNLEIEKAFENGDQKEVKHLLEKQAHAYIRN